MAMAAATLEVADTDTDMDIDWDRMDKKRFHLIGAALFTVQQGLLHPTHVVKTRMQTQLITPSSSSSAVALCRSILRSDGVRGLYRGFATSAIGSLPGRVIALSSLELSKQHMMDRTQHLRLPHATRLALANALAGMLSNLLSCLYFVPLDVISQRLMVQGLPGTGHCKGPLDAVRKVMKTEGIRGLYRGFGLAVLTQPPASALWWGAYAASHHLIWRGLGYCEDNTDKKPSHLEMVTVQATAGMLAGALSSLVTTPIDTVKTRLQVMDDYGDGRPSVIKTTKTLLKEDGWSGFYRGFGPRFLNMSLYGTTMIVTYELIKRLSVKKEMEEECSVAVTRGCEL